MRVYLGLIALTILVIVGVLSGRIAGWTGGPATTAPTTVGPAGPSSDDTVLRSEGLSPVPDRVVPEPIRPSFDIVRIDPTGEAVLAGRAAPGAHVLLLADGHEMADARTTGTGEWTMLIETPLSPGELTLTLQSIGPDDQTVNSLQSVVVVVPDRPDADPLVVLDGPAFGSRVLQGPAPARNDTAPKLAVESVDYDRAGQVLLAGRAEPDAVLRLYLDNEAVGDVSTDSDGVWRLRLNEGVAPGDYALRVDRLDGEGSVRARIEMPFTRAEPEDLAVSNGRVVVQPGNSLWRIARHVYGRGPQYTVIYRANSDQIRDPDLIYPGQIFDIPETVRSEG